MNTRGLRWLLLTVLLAPAGCGTRTETADNVTERGASRGLADSIYSARGFDPRADAAKDLSRTITAATASGKRIILEIGGDW